MCHCTCLQFYFAQHTGHVHVACFSRSLRFPLFFQFSVMGVGAMAGAGFFGREGLVAGLQVGRALGCSGCLGLGSAVPVPHDPGHPTSICDEGINQLSSPYCSFLLC